MGKLAIVSLLLTGGLLGQADRLRPFLAKDAKAPTGAVLKAHLSSLTDLLGDLDPARRDDLAYSLLARWIVTDGAVPDAQLVDLLGAWSKLLASEGNNDEAVLRRSFSALSLALLAARDNRKGFLTKPQFDALLAAAIGYLLRERDERGYDETLGWVHTTAHTADLLRFLGRSRHLAAAQQRQLLDAIAEKLARVHNTFGAGEDARLARAVMAVIDRDDFDAKAYGEWIRSLVVARTFRTRSHELAFAQNRLHLVTALFARLALDREPSEGRKQALAATRLLLGG